MTKEEEWENRFDLTVGDRMFWWELCSRNFYKREV